MSKKTILHLCADTGSDSWPYREAGYEVILVGSEIGVENYSPDRPIHGIFANPVCTEFSTARSNGKARNPDEGMFLVKECQRIIAEANPHFWVIENPAKGVLKDYLGEPTYQYEPWWYGSPWTKKTALWGKFNIPDRLYHKWDDVPKIEQLYTRPTRSKPSMAQQHKSVLPYIAEFARFTDMVHNDMSLRSLCSQGFAKAFYEVNR